IHCPIEAGRGVSRPMVSTWNRGRRWPDTRGSTCASSHRLLLAQRRLSTKFRRSRLASSTQSTCWRCTMTTLSEVLTRNARRAPEREALVSGAARYTYAQLDTAVTRAANALAADGMTKGDRLALLSTNTPGFVITFYAAMRLGLIVVPVNPRM